MAEDSSKMKAQKVSKTDSLKKMISDSLNSNTKKTSSNITKSSSSKKSSNTNSKTKSSTGNNSKSTTKNKSSNTSRNNKSNSQNSVAQIISEVISSSNPSPKKRGRPKKNQNNDSIKEQNYNSTNSSIKTKSQNNNNEKSAKVINNSEKKAFKNEGKSLILFICFLLVGIFSGYFITKFLIFPLAFPNDIYAMVEFNYNGETSADIYLKQDADGSESFTYSDYVELGVKCVAFGKDYSEDYTVTYYYRSDLTQDEQKLNGIEDIDATKEGIYYAVYSVPALKYKTVKLIRNIIVLRGEDDE